MNEIQKKFIESPGRYLMHYNHNHDKLGRFARSNGTNGSIPGGSNGSQEKYRRKMLAKRAKDSYKIESPKNKGMSLRDRIKLEIAWDDVQTTAKKESKNRLQYDLKNNEADRMAWQEAYRKGHVEGRDPSAKKEEARLRKKYTERNIDPIKQYINDEAPNIAIDTHPQFHRNKKEAADYAMDLAIGELIYQPIIDEYLEKLEKKEKK